VDVILDRERECVVDNQPHIRDIEASGSNVCGNHNADLTKGVRKLAAT
jgi:hypothetical protein